MRHRLLLLSLLPALSASLLVSRECRADNPIIQTKFTADPAPLVYDGKVYLYTSHDEDTATGFEMYNWMLYSSADMVNWTDHGIIAGVKAPYKTFQWADGRNAWAPQAIFKDGKFYLYVPLVSNGHMDIGVAVADKPAGPFADPIGHALVHNPNSGDDIDPTVLIDADGQAYLYWGHKRLFYVKLNDDMTSYSGNIVELPLPDGYEEGPWLYKRKDQYYLGFASHCCPEGIGYAMGSKPTGPWTAKGDIMAGNAKSSGNHPGIVDFNGITYVFGFNYAINFSLTSEHRERRSVCVAQMPFAADGTVPPVPWWDPAGVPQVGTLNPFAQTEAETIAWSDSVETETCEEGGMDVTNIEKGDSIKLKGVDFRGGATSFDARVASATSGGNIEIHLDSQTGPLVGTCAVSGTGGWQKWTTVSCPITGAAGVHDMYFVFSGGSGSLLNFNWWKFRGVDAEDGGAEPDGGTRRDGGSGGDASDKGDGGSGGADADAGDVCQGTCGTEPGGCACGVGRWSRDPKGLVALLAAMGGLGWVTQRRRRARRARTPGRW